MVKTLYSILHRSLDLTQLKQLKKATTTSFSIKSLSKLLLIYTATENKKFDRKTIKVNQE